MQINRQTYEEYFLLYIDGELNAGERAAVEQFAEENPELKEELAILGQSVFTADKTISFENKEVLYKEGKDRAAIIFFGWRKIAVAAAVLLFLGAGGWLYLNKHAAGIKPEVVQSKPQVKPATENKTTVVPADEQPAIVKTSVEVDKTKHNRNNISIKDHSIKNKINEQAVIEDKQPEEETALRGTPDIVHEVATVNDQDRKINIPVEARDIASSEVAPVQNAIHYADGDNLSGDNKIYFANTSFSKKNSLRVVFRKASRIIDRITTLQ
jgi:hypothetical protein